MAAKPPRYADRFLRAAGVHEEAARLLLGHCPPRSLSTLCGEVIYLSGYVAECSLKAVLFRWTPESRHTRLFESFKNPKGLGHDLDKLRLALIRAGCPVPARVAGAVAAVRLAWSSQMRYDVERRHFRVAAAVCESAKALFDWVSEG